MVGIKLTDPHKVVTAYLTDFANAELANSRGNKTAELIANMLVGMRISRHYRMDIPEDKRNLIAREFLRGVLTDHAV